MYSKKDKIIMWLSTFDFMSYKKAFSFIVIFGDNLENVFDNLKNYKNTLIKIFDVVEYNELLLNNNLVEIERVIKEYDKLKIKVVTILNDIYPKLLKEISSPPIMLYCLGNLDLLNSDCLGVVGTRRSTRYGKEICNKIVSDIATEDITIVSGLADGIDTFAHKSCLEVKGKTIAVLAGGILNIYPATNTNLAKSIIENNGLIISEYKPNEQSLTYHFPIRNRIIAGLSKAIVIVEATEKSGSMHTKNFALDFNREIFAVPGRINDIYSDGCNKIIANGQARMLLKSSDIIEFFGKDLKTQQNNKAIQLTCEEQLIYSLLEGHEMHFDELLQKTNMKAGTLTTVLMRLEIKGIINKLPRNYYTLVV